ncbi:MAG: NAD(P)/FAD-dependent oxidoreductase [Rhodoferax sp.]|nr:NAD(P)/FAD-dependent oxidoreductase [Rhodoferax sp.]MCF8207828.1 NAD(P)/FAD-dependent oxidoreductase [Rhodoferax sp.]
MECFDAVIIGAGAAGLFCAGVAGQRGLKVLVIDHSHKVAEKIRISGGGRCNFTNLGTSPRNFLSSNPNFCRSALSRFSPTDFVALLQKHHIAFHEKHRGQLFCNDSAQDIISLLLDECTVGKVACWNPCKVNVIQYQADHRTQAPATRYRITTDRGQVECGAIVVATGGLSIPKAGASDLGYRIAQQFELPIVPTQPALVPFICDPTWCGQYSALSGVSLPVQISTGEKKHRTHFTEDLLFTHRGLSGPAALQISSYWQPGTQLQIRFAPDHDLGTLLLQAKATSQKRIANALSAVLPSRLAEAWVATDTQLANYLQRPIREIPDKLLSTLARHLSQWELVPVGTEGYGKAEVTAGGIDTLCLSSQTMESRQPGLYFIGEVVDVTGWLGGYNFQWAWASAFACATHLKTL